MSKEVPVQQLEIIERLASDFNYYAAGCLKVVNKDQETKPFVLNKAQKIIEDKIVELERAQKPVRILVVKARQLGCSTYFSGRFMWNASTKKNQSCLIVAHDHESAQGLLSKTRYFYENLPRELQPHSKYLTKSELFFDDLNTSFKVATANNPSLGRSRTFSHVHLSEAAFYGKEGEKAFLSVLQSVPRKPNTYVVVESTSNGYDNEYYGMVEKALKGESEYEVVFLSWLLDPEYSMGEEYGEDLGTLDSEEMELQKKGATFGQLRWRRWAIENICQGSIEKFHQEYPSNIEESFLYTGSPCFQLSGLTEMRNTVKPIYFSGDIDVVKQDHVKSPGIDYFKMYVPPHPDKTYSIGVDCAEGISGQGLDRDYSVIQVLDALTREQVAVYRSRVPNDVLPYIIKYVGLLYNYAYVCPEINGPGLSVVQKLRELKYRRIYKRRNLELDTPDSTEQMGFRTTKSTKPVLIDTLAELVRERDIKINDTNTLEEMSKFSRDSRGRMMASTGKDDCVIALALAVYNLRYAPVQRQIVTKNDTLGNIRWKPTMDEIASGGGNELDKWAREVFGHRIKARDL